MPEIANDDDPWVSLMISMNCLVYIVRVYSACIDFLHAILCMAWMLSNSDMILIV